MVAYTSWEPILARNGRASAKGLPRQRCRASRRSHVTLRMVLHAEELASPAHATSL
jgi:hypothetical protein